MSIPAEKERTWTPVCLLRVHPEEDERKVSICPDLLTTMCGLVKITVDSFSGDRDILPLSTTLISSISKSRR